MHPKCALAGRMALPSKCGRAELCFAPRCFAGGVATHRPCLIRSEVVYIVAVGGKEACKGCTQKGHVAVALQSQRCIAAWRSMEGKLVRDVGPSPVGYSNVALQIPLLHALVAGGQTQFEVHWLFAMQRGCRQGCTRIPVDDAQHVA